MSDNAKRRLSIDLDEIERQLRQGGPAGGQPPAPKSDPLSELARIVGQDDPFGALLDADKARAGARRADPFDDPVPQAAPARRRAAPADPYPEDIDPDDPRAEYAARGFPVDDDGYVDDPDDRDDEAAYDDGYDDGDAPHDDAADWNGPAEPYADEEEPPRRRAGRKGLVTATALVAVALVGVATALWFSGSVDQAGGEPPLITADSGPARVAPADPGGVEIPNQDTALLDRQDSGEVNVVDREEQPVDIAGLAPASQPARSGPRVVLPAPGGAPAADDPIARAIGEEGLGALSNGLQPPLVSSPAVAALGEPRRVRTVTVRPDGSIVAPGGLSPAPVAQPARTASADPAPLEPTAAVPLEPIAAAPAQPPAPDDLPASALAQPAETAAAAAVAPVPVPVPVPPPAPARPSPPSAAAAPQPAAPQPASPQPAGPLQLSAIPSQAPAAPAASGPTGGYAVQLAIRGSEPRAREAFAQIQAQYASIIGDGEPIIRQAVVNGSTIFRVRVGAYSLERATQACDQIKAVGGDCFVAPNR